MLPQIIASPHKFRGQWPEETIIASVRHHPIVMSKSFFMAILFIAAGVAGLIWLSFAWRIWPCWILIFIGLFILFRQWLMWFLSNFFVTDQRLIMIDYLGLFSRRTQEITYDQVANQNYEIRGFFSTIFSIGSVEIHNLAGTNPLIISDLSHPERLSREISQALHDYQTRQQSSASVLPVGSNH